ncbi:phosphotriesterase family protein [Alkaliphilus peptidifermentans]|uniref:Phosphotriesterase-related protein n=1 Tax=Alkaliphilus peptidifermentans DSM 18978 TaxID=1120976 RepID=A0A1G5ACQ3_9FIRM|nr:hypothetical protein [Alkaliphilus peptidifermentans]SCX75685.1 phosphotriesterase-related protein [Alkaliphilus peptidifermentans DSM 18978]
MINTVLGTIKNNELGLTLCHEHFVVDFGGADTPTHYNREEIIATTLPFLSYLKELGCNTIVDATPNGLGRNIDLLVEASSKSGINFITCTGGWDGLQFDGKYIPSTIKNMSTEEIVDFWSNEFFNGINGTSVKPGFIKIALGDSGFLTDFQLRILLAAIETSLKTNLPIHCHCESSKVIEEISHMLEKENFPLNKFVWLHCDIEKNTRLIKKLAQEGMWVSFDYTLARANDFTWYIEMINSMNESGLIGRLLISQDHCIYDLDEKICKKSMDWVFKDLMLLLKDSGFSQEILDKIFIKNPSIVFNI